MAYRFWTWSVMAMMSLFAQMILPLYTSYDNLGIVVVLLFILGVLMEIYNKKNGKTNFTSKN